MIRKFTLIVLFLFTLGIVSFSQTVSLANDTASPGQNVPVALSVSGFSGIGSITFNIQFDPTVMTFSSMSLLAGTPSGFTAFVTGNTLNLVGSWPNSANFLDGPILNLNFTYNGVTTSPLSFLGSCFVTTSTAAVITPTYTNGSIRMSRISAKATLIGLTVSNGAEADVDLKYENVNGLVGAITQKVQYDPTKLTFVNVIGTGDLAIGLNSSVNSITGVITLTWTKSGGANINTNGLLNKFILKFVYIGSASTAVDFVGGCIVSNAVGANVNIYYTGGTVSPSPFTAFAVLGPPVTNAVQGTVCTVPLTFSGFTSGASGTQAFTLTIPYDASKLSYVGLLASVANLTVQNSSGVLNLVWSDPNGTSINGLFATLKFQYNGIGTANVTFGNNCVFNTYTGGNIGTVQVGYTNTTISPSQTLVNATIGFVNGLSGSNVLVPLNFSGLTTTMGAFTLFITYDVDKLTFARVVNNVNGAIVNETAEHVISITWSSTSVINVNSKFLDLEFEYNNGGGLASAAVNFSDGCELSYVTGSSSVIIPANYINGGVNFKFKVSGYLSYDSPSNKVLGNVNVYLKSGAEPVPPAITPVPAILYSTVTSLSTGYYEFLVPNGTYYLYAASTATWAGVNSGDNTQINRYISNVTPNTLNSSLRLRSADVGQNGTISSADVTAISRRISNLTPNPNFKALDWLFENPIVVVNNLDITNFNFKGLCSGDVNASY